MKPSRNAAIGALCVLAPSGCLAPVSNAVFYDEAEFLAALPSSERFGVPAEWLGGVVGDDPVLASGVEAGAALEGELAPLVASGETLAETLATERTEATRFWEDVPVGDLWVRSEIVRPDEISAATWSIEVAVSREGPWRLLAEGRHEPSGAGAVSLDLDASALLFGTSLGGVMEIAYEPDTDTAPEVSNRSVVFEWFPEGGPSAASQLWAVYGEVAFAWGDTLSLTEDALSWPVGTVAAIGPAGGRAGGTVWRMEERIDYGDCWDAQGNRVWIGGDEGIAEEGSETACALEAPAR